MEPVVALNSREHILIVDDDVQLVDRVGQRLNRAGFQVSVAFTFVSGLEAAFAGNIDLAVLDVMLPDGSGLEILRAVRATSMVPVLMLKTKGDAADRVLGLENGADDYLSKPFDSDELVARVHAILRR